MGALLARLAGWIAPWLVAPVLNWVRDQVELWVLRRKEAKAKADEIRRSNDEVIKRLEEAKSEEEVQDAASDLLKR